MRSVLATHSTGISWQSLHKIATVFDMMTPLQTMPSRYVSRIEEVTDKAVKTSMIGATNELHQRVDRVISPEPDAINITVSFDSSWKTRGFYSNFGFGAVISTNTKKVLDYEILSRLCELCSIWNEDKQQEQPLEYQSWIKRHKPNCNKNFTGSSQAMEPEAAERIWSRSLERNLVYSVYVGDGDGKGFLQVTSLNPYPLVVVRKEECLTHVAKRLKKNLKKVKANNKALSYVQHKLSDWKADYIASNYSTVILQNRGTTPDHLSTALYILLKHAAGDHFDCPSGEDTWCRWNRTSGTSIPTSVSTFTPTDIQKIREVLNTYASPEFCSHLTLGLTQNANESLHNMIWSRCPKNVYVSPRSIRISTALAILTFNETELSLFGIMTDLGLSPSRRVFRSIYCRVMKLQSSRVSQAKTNTKRRRRRLKLAKESREKALLRSEGGSSYKSGHFGSEQTRRRSRGRGAVGRASSRVTKRGVQNRNLSPDSSLPSSNDSTNSDESTTLCAICHLREPEPFTQRRVGHKMDPLDWVCCDQCSEWHHCYCVDVEFESVSTTSFLCHKCSSK